MVSIFSEQLVKLYGLKNDSKAIVFKLRFSVIITESDERKRESDEAAAWCEGFCSGLPGKSLRFSQLLVNCVFYDNYRNSCALIG